VQMTGYKPRRQPGRLARFFRAVTRRSRPTVAANNPKNERLGL
jgi:hypothetical protein